MRNAFVVIACGAALTCIALGLLSAVFGVWPIATLAGIGAAGWIAAICILPRGLR